MTVKRHADIYSGIAILLISIFFFWKSLSLPDNAAVWPKAVLVLMMILSTVLALQGFKKTADAKKSGGEVLRLNGSEMVVPLIAFCAMMVYVTVMNYLGFFVATAIFLPVCMFAMGQRNWIAIIGTTVGIELFIYFLFVTQLKLRMP